MAPKRSSKSRKIIKVLDYKALALNDVLCPICRSILIEPVTLPCQHGFCSSCFDGTMQNANLVCPLCRIRIGSWLRKAKKETKLVNNDLWTAIKETFPQQVKNKLNGIDENFEEEHEVIVSYPGEIRKEYEIQKQKVDEEFRKKCAADIEASEELIRKIKEKEDFEQAVKEEKIKFDEQVAKKLAEELALTSPSTSNTKSTTKKVGPMDKFLKQDFGTSQSVQKKLINNFATKEYTCRVLCLDSNKKNTESDSDKKDMSPIIKRKIQQIKKIVDADVTSDSSDCIESELRYFKPIDHRVNPPSQGKPPIRVPCRKPLRNSTPTISSPMGLINFHSNFLESAFARISFTSPTCIGRNDNSTSQIITHVSKTLKRMHSAEDMSSPTKRKSKSKIEAEEHDDKESPTFNNSKKPSRTKKQLFGESNYTVQEECVSPPFYGFENSDLKNNNSGIVKVRRNGLKTGAIDDEISKKLLQEMADLEFAKKLQDEFNRNMHYTRSSRRTTTSSKRQATLEELIKTPYRVT